MGESKDKNINISPVPKFVDTALTNITDAPTRQIGTTFKEEIEICTRKINQIPEKDKTAKAHFML